MDRCASLAHRSVIMPQQHPKRTLRTMIETRSMVQWSGAAPV